MSARRADLAVDVHDVAVLERAHDLADRVGLADVGEELVAQPLPLGRAAHDAGDVDEATPWPGRIFSRAEDLGERAEPRVRQRDDADVGLDRRERVVRREHVVLGQRVEERGLADVGQADDSDGECHEDKSLVAIAAGCRPRGRMPSRAAHASVHSQPGCQSNGALTSCSSGAPSSRCCSAQRLAEWAMTSTRSPVVVAAHVAQEAAVASTTSR